jgi:hypothetical protein
MVRLDVEELHALLCEQLAVLQPCAVAAVLRVFVEVSSLPCEQRLWSLEFGFDHDEGRIARLVAAFVDRRAKGPPGDELHGYEVAMMLPRVLPPRAPSDGLELEGPTGGSELSDGALVARFESALAELGAYRSIETIELVSAEAHLL